MSRRQAAFARAWQSRASERRDDSAARVENAPARHARCGVLQRYARAPMPACAVRSAARSAIADMLAPRHAIFATRAAMPLLWFEIR